MLYMRTKLWPAAALTVLLITSNTLPLYAANAGSLPEMPNASQDSSLISASTPPEERDAVSSGDLCPTSGNTQTREPAVTETEISDPSDLDRTPAFSAHIEYFHGQGYVVKGNFTEFLPNTSLVQPLYSLEGEVWQSCPETWNLQCLNSENADELKQLQNQICLYGTHEPLAGYLTGQLNRFFMKLQITLDSGIAYETQSAVIDRGGPQPLPEEFNPVAIFVPAMLIRQWRPFQQYGQYQLTVSADATPEDAAALLPDTIPMDVQLYAGIDFVANATVDCPVTWKALSLSRLTPGESIVIADAAEEIIVPAGTLLNTPIGVFQLEEPLGVEHNEIRLILNVAEEDTSSSENTCEPPDQQSDLNGSGGNECNAGSDNKNDSTSEGQRPNLPQNPEDGTDTQTPQMPEVPQMPEDGADAQTPQMPENETDIQTSQIPETPQNPTDKRDPSETGATHPAPPISEVNPEGQPNASQTIKAIENLPPEQYSPSFQTRDPDSAPELSMGSDSPTWEKTAPRSGHLLRWVLFPVSAAAIGICIPIAAGKASAGSAFGRIFRKMLHLLSGLIHLK